MASKKWKVTASDTAFERNSFIFIINSRTKINLYQIFPTPEEFLGLSQMFRNGLSQMFRNEGPISFNTHNQYFFTGSEPVGEGEADLPPPRIE